MTTPAVATASLKSEALGRIRDYTDPEGINKRTNRLMAANQATAAPTRQAYADFNHAIQYSDDYNEILDAALAAVDSHRYNTAAEMISTELREHVRMTRVLHPVYDLDATRPAFAFLDEQLRDLMRVVRKQEKHLRGITTPHEALRGGGEAQDAWAILDEQLDRYVELRRLQRHILIALGDKDAAQYRIEVINRSGTFAASFDHGTHYTGARLFWRTSRPERAARELDDWLTTSPRPPFTLTGNDVLPGDGIAYLRWISAGDKAWIPDEAELFRVDELAQTMLSGVLPAQKREQAKHAYYDDRGLTPAKGAKVSIA